MSATMAGLLFNSNYDNKTDGALLNQLSESWFSQNRSTPAMVIGAKMRARYYRHFQSSVTLGAHLKWDYWKIKPIYGWLLHQTEWQL
jgi:hypothetical protein